MPDNIGDISARLIDICAKYELDVSYIDITDITLVARIKIFGEIFIQIYANTRKNKLNMALVLSGQRIYGIDNEGGFYHEHPVDNPDSHLPSVRIELQEFFEQCLGILKTKKII
jgi:hypothetical protein